MATLTPAYGRDYRSKATVLADWEDNKDFQMQPSGQYCSIRDRAALLERDGFIEFRYSKQQKVFVIQNGQ